MSRHETLKSFEIVLESFLERAINLKEKRLSVLSGINRLDDIARIQENDTRISDNVGQWFAEHNNWLTDSNIRPGDISRINNILGEISKRLDIIPEKTPEKGKIRSEINRWQNESDQKSSKIVLKRSSEVKAEATPDSSIDRFKDQMTVISEMFKNLSQYRQHVLSVLDETLKIADLQKCKEALLLSAFIIYSLKQEGYKTEPYIKRLKIAEQSIGKGVKR